MTKAILAISGGVDSVVMLDILSKSEQYNLIVAHVDHGIRGADSAGDARFVEALAGKYKLPFVSTQLNLGADTSEELARIRRYEFLLKVAHEHQASVMTAHHRDDVVETIALNILRGTGWRGLGVLARSDIVRPLLGLWKWQILSYAVNNRLEWVEDATNATSAYTRNRLRHKIAEKLDQNSKDKLANLRASQLILRHEISHETRKLLAKHAGDRGFLTQINSEVAKELLGADIVSEGGIRPLGSQLSRALQAVKTMGPNKKIEVGNGVEISFKTRKYSIKVLQ